MKDCQFWTGTTDRNGYGVKVIPGTGGRRIQAHRVAYAQAYGSFDPKLRVMHRCDHPACVNPKHLFLGTQADNMRDMKEKGRANGGFRNMKLSHREAHKIRMLYWNFGLTQLQIASHYKVHPVTIGCLLKGETWKRYLCK